MKEIKKFEDIESWELARKLTCEIYKATSTGVFVRDFGLKDQIRRASVSILSNIAEGFERGNDKEFAHFLAIAKALLGRCVPNYMWPWTRGIFRPTPSIGFPSQ